jgi:hypothetical protein
MKLYQSVTIFIVTFACLVAFSSAVTLKQSDAVKAVTKLNLIK